MPAVLLKTFRESESTTSNRLLEFGCATGRYGLDVFSVGSGVQETILPEGDNASDMVSFSQIDACGGCMEAVKGSITVMVMLSVAAHKY